MASAPRTPLARALADGNWPARHPHGHFLVASATYPELDYTVSADARTCECEAAQHGRPDCKHRAAVRWCLAHHVWAAYYLCANCRSVRVRKDGQMCRGCANLAEAEAERLAGKLIPFRVGHGWDRAAQAN